MKENSVKEFIREQNRRFVDGLLSSPVTVPETKQEAEKQYVQQVLFPLMPLEGGDE